TRPGRAAPLPAAADPLRVDRRPERRLSCARDGRTRDEAVPPEPARARARSGAHPHGGRGPGRPTGEGRARAARARPSADRRYLAPRRLAPGELHSRLQHFAERVLLLLEILAEERNDVVLAHRVRVRDQVLVDGDLVVLRLRASREDHRVVQLVLRHLQVRLPFLLDALDRRARLLVGLVADRLEDLVEVADLPLRLLAMVPELLLQLAAVRLFDELAEHLLDGVLHRQRGAELVDEELLRVVYRRAFQHVDPLARCRFEVGFPGQAGSMLVLSDQAVQVIRDLVAEGDVGPDGGLRISGSASNGETALDFELAEEPVEGDEVLTIDGAVLFLDETAAAVLADKTLDVHAHGDHFHFSLDEQS